MIDMVIDEQLDTVRLVDKIAPVLLCSMLTSQCLYLYTIFLFVSGGYDGKSGRYIYYDAALFVCHEKSSLPPGSLL